MKKDLYVALCRIAEFHKKEKKTDLVRDNSTNESSKYKDTSTVYRLIGDQYKGIAKQRNKGEER